MKTYKDPSKSKESKWFQFNPLIAKNNFVGIDREDGKTSITLEPGDIVQLSPMEIYANQDRPCFTDGMMTEIPENKVKDAVKKQFKPEISSDEDVWAAYDDVEYLNQASVIKSRGVLRTLLDKAKKQDRGYKCISGMEKLIETAPGI